MSLACVRQSPEVPGNNQSRNGLEPTPVTRSVSPTPPVAGESPEWQVEEWFAAKVDNVDNHTAIVATLQPGRTIARLNPDRPFNPASLVKLATSFVALKKLGSDYRFTIPVHTDGHITNSGVLEGDLYFSGYAPTFNETSAEVVKDALRERNIKRLTGSIHVSPKFSFDFSDSPEQSAELLARRLFPTEKTSTAVSETPVGRKLFVFKSHPLKEVLLYQNTYSSNFVAHRVGDLVGGPGGIKQYLVNELGMDADQIQLETTSGLGNNKMTARSIFALLRELEALLKTHGLTPYNILPIADESPGTLRTRLDDSQHAGAVAAKTGTLSAADGGVGIASLAGLINTRSGSIYGFVLIDQGPEVSRNRDVQDEFLREILGKRVEPQRIGLDLPRDLLPKSGLLIEPVETEEKYGR